MKDYVQQIASNTSKLSYICVAHQNQKAVDFGSKKRDTFKYGDKISLYGHKPGEKDLASRTGTVMVDG